MTPHPAYRGLLLTIDAAPGVGSVALLRDGMLLRTEAVAMRPAVLPGRAGPDDDDDPLMGAVADVLRDAASDRQRGAMALNGVACGSGPGGFTSLRIAAALAKGIAHAAGCTLLAAPSLAWAAAVRAPASGVWLVTLDALRGERYVAVVELTDAEGQGRATYSVAAYQYFGVCAAAAMDRFAEAHGARGRLDVEPDATAAPIAAGAVALPPTPVDLASWEPAYGRLAEAQARWEAAHGPLPSTPVVADA